MSNTCKIQAPVVTATLAAGSTTSPYFALCNITQQLCYKACTSDTPVFSPSVTLTKVTEIGTGQYIATFAVSGIVSYVRCGSQQCVCCTQQPISAEFTLPIAATSAPSVAVAQGTAVMAMAENGCSDCSRTFVCEIPLTLTVTTA